MLDCRIEIFGYSWPTTVDPLYTATANGSWMLCHSCSQTSISSITGIQMLLCTWWPWMEDSILMALIPHWHMKIYPTQDFSRVLWSWISKLGKFLLKLKVHLSGKFAPWVTCYIQYVLCIIIITFVTRCMKTDLNGRWHCSLPIKFCNNILTSHVSATANSSSLCFSCG